MSENFRKFKHIGGGKITGNLDGKELSLNVSTHFADICALAINQMIKMRDDSRINDGGDSMRKPCAVCSARHVCKYVDPEKRDCELTLNAIEREISVAVAAEQMKIRHVVERKLMEAFKNV